MSIAKEESPTYRRNNRVSSWETLNPLKSDNLQVNPVRISISRITDDELAKMSTRDLVDLLAFSSLVSQWADLLRELPRGGKSGLQLLASLARRRCRDEMDSICATRGLPFPQYPACEELIVD